MKKVFLIFSTGKRKTWAALLCCTLILCLSTGMAFAANTGNSSNLGKATAKSGIISNNGNTGTSRDNGSVVGKKIATDVMVYSVDEGKTWMSEEDYYNAYPPLTEWYDSIEWYTYDEYRTWIETQKKSLQEMVDTGEQSWNQTDGWFIWTQEMADQVISRYEQTLEDIKNGAKVSKSLPNDEDGAFSYNPAANNTAVADTSPSVIAEQYAARFEKYKDYGLTYDKAADNLHFNGELVRYFEDYYPVGDNAYAGVDYFNENGTIDAHGVRDLSQILHNADGSYDPSGKLIGVEPYSKAEFDARDIDKLINPPQSVTAVHADSDMTYTSPQVPQQNNSTAYAVTTDVTDTRGNNRGQTIPQVFEKYKDYGITFDENSVNGGLGNMYYQGQLVKAFADVQPNGGVLSLSSSDGGSIKVRTVYDENGKLTGVEVVKN